MSIQLFEEISLSICLASLILYMLFILYRPGRNSNASRYRMFVIFFVPGPGIFGFAAKSLIALPVNV